MDEYFTVTFLCSYFMFKSINIPAVDPASTFLSVLLLYTGIGLFERVQIDFLHSNVRRKDPVGLFVVLVCHHFPVRLGYDLPGKSEFILEPSALDFLSPAGTELFPDVVDFLLRCNLAFCVSQLTMS